MAWTVRVPDPRPVREEDHRSDRERRRPKRHSGDGSYGAASAPAAEVTYLGKWVADALNQLEVLVEKMKEAQRELSRSVDRKGIDEVTGAFVTFEHEWSAFRCAQDYAHSRYAFLRHSFQPLNLRLHRRAHFAARQKARRREQDRQGPLRASERARVAGRPPSPGDDVEAEGEAAPGSASMRAVPLSCRPAAAPDDVLWENLGVPSYVKNLRRAGTLFLSAVMLAGTSSLVRYKIRVMAEVVRPETSTCREAIAAHLGRYYDNETCAQVDRLYTNRSFQCPGPREDFLGHRDVDYGVAAPRGRACRGGSCVAPRSALAVPGSNATVDRSRFCGASAGGLRGAGVAESDALRLALPGPRRPGPRPRGLRRARVRRRRVARRTGGEVCSDRDARRTRYSRNDLVECYCDREVRCKEQRLLHFERLMLRYAWTHARKFLGRSAPVLFAAFAKVERHDSISTQLVNTAWKTFFLIFLNTAFLVPVFNMKCEPTWRGDLGLTDFFCEHVFIGEYVGFTKSWYENVGRTVVLSVALNMVVSVLSRFGTVSLLDPLVAWCWRDGCVTQTQLNELFQPRRFDIEYRYSFALTYVLCALVYCSGLPVLVPLTAAYFWASYVADRPLTTRPGFTAAGASPEGVSHLTHGKLERLVLSGLDGGLKVVHNSLVAVADAGDRAAERRRSTSPLRRASESLKLTPVDGARSVLFGAKRWTEQHSKQAILEGWRLLDAAAAAPGLVELQRVHSARHGLKSDVLMRTWEIIVEEKRLASYDIMANPRYRLARVVQLKDRCNRENLERRLTTKVHEIRLEVVRRQEAVKNVVDARRASRRDVARRAEARVAAARLRLARAAALHLSSEVGAAARGLVDAVERRVLYGEALGRSACSLPAGRGGRGGDVVREAAADAAARDGARAAADRLVAAVEARSLAATLTRPRRSAPRGARPGRRVRAIGAPGRGPRRGRAARRGPRARARRVAALDDSRTLVASYERVAKITEAAAEREAKANRTVVEALERENRRVHEAWGDARRRRAPPPGAAAPPALALPPRPATDVEATQTTARSEPAPARDTREEQAQTDLHLDAVFESHRSSMTAAEEAIEAAEHAERATRREADEAQARVLAAEAEAARALRDATEARATARPLDDRRGLGRREGGRGRGAARRGRGLAGRARRRRRDGARAAPRGRALDAAVEDLRASRDAADRDRESVAKLARERSDSDRRASALEDELRATRDVLATALTPPARGPRLGRDARREARPRRRPLRRAGRPRAARRRRSPALRDVDAIVEDALRGSRSDLFANRGGAGGGGVVLLQAPRHRGPLSSQ
ncbi:hypothetical protein JL722_11922 [Aureococcus anophagefferens]|nr:hypothetical protein JL722_11922 [Aureococcus anophagefferens]